MTFLLTCNAINSIKKSDQFFAKIKHGNKNFMKNITKDFQMESNRTEFSMEMCQAEDFHQFKPKRLKIIDNKNLSNQTRPHQKHK